jgi:hypothetical protein
MKPVLNTTVMPYSVVAGTNILDEPASSIFRSFSYSEDIGIGSSGMLGPVYQTARRHIV